MLHNEHNEHIMCSIKYFKIELWIKKKHSHFRSISNLLCWSKHSKRLYSTLLQRPKKQWRSNLRNVCLYPECHVWEHFHWCTDYMKQYLWGGCQGQSRDQQLYLGFHKWEMSREHIRLKPGWMWGIHYYSPETWETLSKSNNNNN